MELKMIETPEEHEAALAELDRLMDLSPAAGTPESERLKLVAHLIEHYEMKHFPDVPPTPLEAIAFHMDRLGWTRKNLEPLIGSRARVSEVLNGKVPLSKTMIRRLHDALGISFDVLMQAPPVQGRVKRWVVLNGKRVALYGSSPSPNPSPKPRSSKPKAGGSSAATTR